MSLSADRLLERIKLKSQITVWRSVAIIISVLFALFFISKTFGLSVPSSYIAKLNVEGVIVSDDKRIKALNEVKNNPNVKALIVYIDSPGGTIVGGETLYDAIKDISQVKPVVVTMGNLAASGGYMTALAGERIYSRTGTLTGSIGVILQSFNIEDMANKIGIDFVTFRSGNMKGVPSPMSSLDTDQKQVIQAAIDETQKYFMNLVRENRNLTEEQLSLISDGRIFTGVQALENNLIDEIGGQEDAVKWLEEKKKISKNLEVRKIKIDREDGFLDQISSKVLGKSVNYDISNLNGLAAIWKP